MTVFAYPGQVSTPGLLKVPCQETLAIPRIAQNPMILAGRLGGHGLAIWVPWADDFGLSELPPGGMEGRVARRGAQSSSPKMLLAPIWGLQCCYG